MEIIPKEAPRLSKAFNVLFYFGLALLFFSIASFFILNHLIGELQREFVVLESAWVEGAGPEQLALEQEILTYQKKIDNFSFLIGQRLGVSKIFTAFQDVCHPRVWFSRFSLNLEEREISVLGQAQSFEVLGQQIFIFQNENWIKDIDLRKISIDKEGGIDFSLSFSFDPQFLAND